MFWPTDTSPADYYEVTHATPAPKPAPTPTPVSPSTKELQDKVAILTKQLNIAQLKDKLHQMALEGTDLDSEIERLQKLVKVAELTDHLKALGQQATIILI